MGLSKEIFRKSGETRSIFPRVNPIPQELQPVNIPTSEHLSDMRIYEIPRILSTDKKGKDNDSQPQVKNPRKYGFEPFINPEPQDDQLFVNEYNGNFAQQMELNREGVEQLLKIAHLEGKVILTSLNSSRQRSIEANPDGSVTSKRSLFIRERIEDDKENPLHRAIPIPEGWRIEINDGKIMENLTAKNLTGEKLKKKFAKEFNNQLKQGIKDSIVKEKLTTTKDDSYKIKLGTLALVSAGALLLGTSLFSSMHPILATGGTIVTFLMANGYTNISILIFEKKLSSLLPISPYTVRKTDAPWEYFMPLVEVDKVLRSLLFLTFKGKRLVKESKDK